MNNDCNPDRWYQAHWSTPRNREIVRLTKGNRLLEEEVHEGQVVVAGVHMSLSLFADDGWTITMKQPPVPQEPGFYTDRWGARWMRADYGDSRMISWDGMRHSDQFTEPFAPFTRIEG